MDLKLPHLGEGADSGTVVNLFVKEGDTIAKDQPILELENEKAVATIPSTAAGTVTQIFVKPGDKIRVGPADPLAQRGRRRGCRPPRPSASPPRPEAARQIIQTPSPEQVPVRARRGAAGSRAPEVEPGTAPAAAPSIRKLARDLGIDLTRVRGSARGGRILLEDVRAYIQRLQRLAAGTPGSCAGGDPPLPSPRRSRSTSRNGAPYRKRPSRPCARSSPGACRRAGPPLRASPSSTRPISRP